MRDPACNIIQIMFSSRHQPARACPMQNCLMQRSNGQRTALNYRTYVSLLLRRGGQSAALDNALTQEELVSASVMQTLGDFSCFEVHLSQCLVLQCPLYVRLSPGSHETELTTASATGQIYTNVKKGKTYHVKCNSDTDTAMWVDAINTLAKGGDVVPRSSVANPSRQAPAVGLIIVLSPVRELFLYYISV